MTMLQALAGLILLTMFAAMAWLIVHARTETVYRPLAIIAFLLGFPVVYGAMATATGTPKPVMLYNAPQEGIILGFKSDTGKGVYVLLDTMNGPPTYYAMPWDSMTAEKIEESLREGKGRASLRFNKGKRVKKGNFDFDWPWDIPAPEVIIEPTESKMPDKDPGNPTAGFRLTPGAGND